MASENIHWVKVADSVPELPFADNGIAEVEADGRKICVGRYNDQLFAFAFKCPHAGGRLAYGFIDGAGNIVCPLHRYKFSMKNGRNVSGEGFYLKHWPVDIREDGIYVGMDHSKWFNWI